MKYKLIIKFAFCKGLENYDDPALVQQFMDESLGTIDEVIDYADYRKEEEERKREEFREELLADKESSKDDPFLIETFRQLNEIIDRELATDWDCSTISISFNKVEEIFKRARRSRKAEWNTNILIHSMTLIDLDNNTTILISWGEENAKRIYYSKEALVIWNKIMENKDLIKVLKYSEERKGN